MTTVVQARRTSSASLQQHAPVSGLRWWREVGWRHVVGIVMIAVCVLPLLYVLSASLNPGGTLTGSNQLFGRSRGRTTPTCGGATSASGCSTRCWSAPSPDRHRADGRSRRVRVLPFRFSGRRGSLTFLLLQMFPQMLAFVAIFLLLLSCRRSSGDRAGHPAGADHRLPGWRARVKRSHVRVLQHRPARAGRGGEDRRRLARADLLGIILRLVTPILAVVGCSRSSVYGEFIVARVVLQQPARWTLAVGCTPGPPTSAPRAGPVRRRAVLAAIPVILLFQFLQKYIVSGLTAGAVKG